MAAGAASVTAPAGNYNNLTITVGSCTSGTGVNITITAPSGAYIMLLWEIILLHAVLTEELTLHFTNVPDGTYTITHAAGTFTNVTVAAGAATVTAPAGNYNNLTITVGSCTSRTGVNVTITAPLAPDITAFGSKSCYMRC